MLPEDILNTVGDFTWSFHNTFFVETDLGNFVWSDPDYDGDNSFTYVDYEYKEWLKKEGIPYGRSKGKHVIRDYCGEDIVLK